MGWKKFADKFNIKHIVIINPKENCLTIRSGYLNDIVSFSLNTGKIIEKNNSINSRFLEENYPELLNVKPQELLEIFNEKDVFEKDILIYHFDFASNDIQEKYCEDPSYPNVTHDGMLIYENTFSTDREKIIAYGARSIKEDEAFMERREKEVQKDLKDIQDRKELVKMQLKAFNEKYNN